jgi:hypothetical protein
MLSLRFIDLFDAVASFEASSTARVFFLILLVSLSEVFRSKAAAYGVSLLIGSIILYCSDCAIVPLSEDTCGRPV